MPNEYQVRVPGKLFIAGEYAVLDPGQLAIVVAVDRYMTATIKESNDNLLSLPQLNLSLVTWTGSGENVTYNVSDSRLRFIQHTISVVEQYLQGKEIKLQPLHLEITSELDDQSGSKYGLGSSAAVVVSVVTSMLNFYKSESFQISHELIFKLSAIAHVKTQGNGSGADIAASTFGGWICYTAFQADWLIEELEDGKTIENLIKEDWPNLMIEAIIPPTDLRLCVGWTGSEASTAPMITKVQALRENQPTIYQNFLKESSSAVANLVESFKHEDVVGAILSMKQNRNALTKLSRQANSIIETPMLTKLAEIAENFGSGKTSGAGGGDCGIAFVQGAEQEEYLRHAWQVEKILPLELKVSKEGISVKKL
ncbi:phosphomevalonate kinase [Aquibacillus halophilus]|uniref:phosphomevalonate kinase n=1 Tax=Aquibacillus halophilus TaxID=930132 RepID=A0A6A8DL10_9BACI|nr:phosphomevalonate kinase [Aquibacillus halophilus]MRH44439.1 phosphomevalonate kinase [Aquibacillus halophilus]